MTTKRKPLLVYLADRFKVMPMVFVYIVAASVMLFVLLENNYKVFDCLLSVFTMLVAGISLSAAGYQWNRVLRFSKDIIIQSTVAVFVAGYSFILIKSPDYFRVSTLAAIGTFGFVSLFFVPSSGVKSDNWNNTAGTVETYIFQQVSMFVMGIVTAVFIYTLDSLFGFENADFSYALVTILVCLLPLTISFCKLPLADRPKYGHRWIKAVGLWFLLPVVVIYGLILYAYLLKIVATWSFPKGTVSWLISGFLIVAFILWWTMHGSGIKQSAKQYEAGAQKFVCRVLPWTMLPLVVLMSVAIFYRIGEYGITPRRIYLAAFNVWSYFAVLYIAACPQVKTNVVAWSFSVFFLLVTVIPGFNFTQMSIDRIEAHFAEDMRSMGFNEYPVKGGTFIEALAQLPEDEYEEVLSTVDILCRYKIINNFVVGDDEDEYNYGEWWFRNRVNALKRGGSDADYVVAETVPEEETGI